jgi:AraC-like DNA-binding protein
VWKPIATVPGGDALSQQLSEAFARQSSVAELALRRLAAGSWAPDDRPFRAELATRFLPTNMLFRVRLSRILQRWNMGQGSRHTHVGVVIDGAIDVSTPTATTTHVAGSAYIFPRWGWVETKVREEVDLVHIAVATSRLHDLGVDTDPQRRIKRFDDSTLISELRAAASAALEASEATAHADLVTDRVISELASGLFLGSATPSQGAPDALRPRALALIERIHTDPLVHGSDVAEMLNVSLRQLQRAFAGEPVGIADELRNRRAETAIRLMSAAGTRGRSIEELARLAGFPSAYALRSEFARRDLGTPSSLRPNR